MPKQYLTIGQYHGGVNSKDSPRDIQRHELAKITNMMVDRIGRMRSMGTITAHGAGTLSASLGTLTGGTGLLAFRTDQPGEEDLFAIGHTSGSPLEATIHIIEEDGTVVDNFSLGTATAFDPAMYYADGALRVADRNFGSSLIPHWWGRIDRTDYLGSGTERDLDEWLDIENDLATMTELKHDTGSPPSGGAGFYIQVSSTADEGDWTDATYEIAGSFLYENKQESSLYIPTADNTFSTTVNDKIYISITTQGGFAKRITGARIYIRIEGSDDPWILLADISLPDGGRATLDSSYGGWTKTEIYTTDTGYIATPNADTYETINGFPSNEQAIAIGEAGMGFKAAVVTNRRAFIANVKTYNDDGQLVHMGDRIMYSPVNKFDTFPTSQILDLGINDGDEFTALESYADRLYAFKEHVLYVINIASGSDTLWYRERTEAHRGVKTPAAVTKTEYGITWANYFGAFLDNGNQTVNLAAQFSDPSQPLDQPPQPPQPPPKFQER